MSTKTRKCSIRELHPELQTVLNSYLDNNEEILLCFETKRRERLLIIPMEDSVTAQIITEKRIVTIMYSHLKLAGRPPSDRIVGPDSLHLSNIVQCQAHWSEGLDIGVKAVGHGAEMFLYFESVGNQREWIATLESAMEKERTRRAEPNSRIVASLRDLAQLHKEGLINDEEFEMKRKQLLDEL